MLKNVFLLVISALFVFCITAPVYAWKLAPEGTEIEKKLAERSSGFWENFLSGSALKGIHKLGNPIHEEITNRTLGCKGDVDVCGDADIEPANAYFIAGVRWNDDPPFKYATGQGKFAGCTPGDTVRLAVQPRCWANTFQDAAKRAAAGEVLNGKNAPLLARSHFGDLQFLHAMASAEGETAAETRDKILMWAEFTWRVGTGEFDNEKILFELPIVGFANYFQYSKQWRVQDLFALGNPFIRKPRSMSQVAIGSLLHVIQDSFADGHVERRSPTGSATCLNMPVGVMAPGKIVEFHSYAHQDSEAHGESDTREALSNHWTADSPSVVDVSQYLIARFEAKDSWDAIRPFIACIFALDVNPNPASSGERYAKRN
jgi:hypothetical protein